MRPSTFLGGGGFANIRESHTYDSMYYLRRKAMENNRSKKMGRGGGLFCVSELFFCNFQLFFCNFVFAEVLVK